MNKLFEKFKDISLKKMSIIGHVATIQEINHYLRNNSPDELAVVLSIVFQNYVHNEGTIFKQKINGNINDYWQVLNEINKRCELEINVESTLNSFVKYFKALSNEDMEEILNSVYSPRLPVKHLDKMFNKLENKDSVNILKYRLLTDYSMVAKKIFNSELSLVKELKVLRNDVSNHMVNLSVVKDVMSNYKNIYSDILYKSRSNIDSLLFNNFINYGDKGLFKFLEEVMENQDINRKESLYYFSGISSIFFAISEQRMFKDWSLIGNYSKNVISFEDFKEVELKRVVEKRNLFLENLEKYVDLNNRKIIEIDIKDSFNGELVLDIGVLTTINIMKGFKYKEMIRNDEYRVFLKEKEKVAYTPFLLTNGWSQYMKKVMEIFKDEIEDKCVDTVFEYRIEAKENILKISISNNSKDIDLKEIIKEVENFVKISYVHTFIYIEDVLRKDVSTKILELLYRADIKNKENLNGEYVEHGTNMSKPKQKLRKF